MKRHLNRRTFLKSAAAAALTAPFLRILDAHGATHADSPRRLIIMFSPNGSIIDKFMPEPGANERDFALSPILEPFANLKDDIVVLEGVDNESAKHGPGAPHDRAVAQLLTGKILPEGQFTHTCCPESNGWPEGPSVDQYIAQQLNLGDHYRFPTLELGTGSRSGRTFGRMIYAGKDQPISPEADPQRAFDRIFANLDDVEGPQYAEIRKQQRLSILDDLTSDFDELNRRLGHEDRQLLDQHLTSLRGLERRVESFDSQAFACEPPSLDVAGAEYERHCKLQTDILVTAMACGLTSVGSIMFSQGQGAVDFSFLDQSITGEHHSLSHKTDDTSRNQIAQINHWYAARVAYLVEKLKSVPEGEGTMLDNTMVVWVNELSDGWRHNFDNMPYLVAGGKNLGIDTGRFVQYSGKNHHGLLISMCHAMGLMVDTFGDTEFCNGPLPGLAV